MRKILAGVAALAVSLSLVGAPASAASRTEAEIVPVAAAPAPGPKVGKGKDGLAKGMPNIAAIEAKRKGGRGGAAAAAVPPTNPTDPLYFYGTAYEFESSLEGVFAGLKVSNVYKNSLDSHTLVEIAIQSSDQMQTVEIGWGKGAWCATSAPCLFVYHWINGVGQGYNVGFADYAGSALNPGDAILTETAGCATPSSPRTERFLIRALTNGWGFWADLCYGDTGTGSAGQWIGEIPFSRWTNAGAPSFTRGGLTQVFGEIATKYDTAANAGYDAYPCTDMGPGGLASSTNGPYPASGQRIGDVVYVNQPLTDVDMITSASSTGDYMDADMPGAYEAHEITGVARYFNVGGYGWAGEAGGMVEPGVAGGC